MSRLKFGAFLAPHHPIGEHPTLQLRNDLDFAAQLDPSVRDKFLELVRVIRENPQPAE